MKLMYLVPMFAVGCYGGERELTGQCPAGEVCSPQTPDGLEFVGNSLADEIELTGPIPTAVGGTQDIDLQYDDGTGIWRDLDMPFTVDAAGAAGVAIDHVAGSIVTVRGVASLENYLRVLDANGDLMDRTTLQGSTVDTIALTVADFEEIPVGEGLVFATGEQSIGIALSSNGVRLVDTSMILALDGSDRPAWDVLHVANATVGHHAVTVTTGANPAQSLDLEVVDHADAIALLDDANQSLAVGEDNELCFAATNAGRFVAGLTWTFSSDNGTAVAPGPATAIVVHNCAIVTPATSGVAHIQATAGGQTMTATVTVGNDAATIVATPSPRRTLLGERAAIARGPVR